MKTIRKNQTDFEDQEQIEQRFIEAGYQTIVHPRKTSSGAADFIAYASGPGGASLGTAVEIKNGENLNLAVEAMRLNMVRNRMGAQAAMIISGSKIFELNLQSNQLEELRKIPKVVPSADPISDTLTISQLFWQLTGDSRGSESLANLISGVMEGTRFDDGVVHLPNTSMRIQGAAFRKFVGNLFASGGLSGAEYAASTEVQFVFKSLAKLFPGVKSIFDPFFGLGLSAFAIADEITESSIIASVSGIEHNQVVGEIARSLSGSLHQDPGLDLKVASAEEADWPSADLLIAEPPLGVRLKPGHIIADIDCKDLEAYTIMRSAEMVRAGKIGEGAVIVTGRSWLTRQSYQRLRDQLIDMDIVHGLLGLPGIKANTSIPLVALVLSRQKNKTVVGELLEDWREQLSGEAGNLYEYFKK